VWRLASAKVRGETRTLPCHEEFSTGTSCARRPSGIPCSCCSPRSSSGFSAQSVVRRRTPHQPAYIPRFRMPWLTVGRASSSAASGVEFGNVQEHPVNRSTGTRRIRCRLRAVERTVQPTSRTAAQIRYRGTSSQPYLENQPGLLARTPGKVGLPAGGFIPDRGPSPRRDLDALHPGVFQAAVSAPGIRRR